MKKTCSFCILFCPQCLLHQQKQGHSEVENYCEIKNMLCHHRAAPAPPRRAPAFFPPSFENQIYYLMNARFRVQRAVKMSLLYYYSLSTILYKQLHSVLKSEKSGVKGKKQSGFFFNRKSYLVKKKCLKSLFQPLAHDLR